MSLPVGVSAATVSWGSLFDSFGEDAEITVEVTPIFGGNAKALSWAATGQSMVAFASSASGVSGASASWVSPHVDQPGFKDGAGNDFTMWSYQARATVRRGGQVFQLVKAYQPLVGQTTIDLDLVPDGSIGAPTSSPVASVTSLDGLTGAVTTAQFTDLVASRITGKQDAGTLADDTAGHVTDGSALDIALVGKIGTTTAPALATKSSSRGLYMPSETANLRWRTRRNQVLAGLAQGHIAILGTSVSFGAAASGTTAPKYATSWPGRLRTRLTAKYGDAGTGWVLCQPNIRANPTWDNRFTYAGAVTDQGFGLHASACFRIDAVPGATVDFTASCSEFWVLNFNGAGGANTAKVDGSSVGTFRNVATGGAAVTIAKEAGYHSKLIVSKIPAGASGTHTLQVVPDTSNASFDTFLSMVEARKPTLGTIRVSNVSVNGKSQSTLVAGNDETNALTGLPLVDTLQADLLVFDLATNDWTGAIAVATTKARVKELVQRQRATGTNAGGGNHANGDAMLVWNPQPDFVAVGASESTWNAYRSMCYEVAVEEDVPLLDMGGAWKDYVTGNGLGLFGDGIHPNDKGSADLADIVERTVMTA